MKKKSLLTTICPIALMTMLSNPAFCGLTDGLGSAAEGATSALEKANSVVNTVNQGSQALEVGTQAVNVVQSAPSEGLTNLLMQRLNVSQSQAEGGAGSLFQFAKGRMEESAFNELNESVPGMSTYLGAAQSLSPAPKTGAAALVDGVSAMTGVSSDTINSVGSLVGSFQQLGMSGDMVQKFIPVVTEYVKTNGSQALSNALMSALTGGL